MNDNPNVPMAAASTQFTQIWSHLEKSMSSPTLSSQTLTNEQCDVTFSDPAQQKPCDSRGQIAIVFTGAGNLPEVQK